MISTGHYLLPVLFYGVIGAKGVFSAASAASTAGELCKQLQGAESKILLCSQAVKDVAIKAAEEAGWGRNGGGRVVLMGEEKEWSLRVVQAGGELGPNLIDERQKLGWEKITDPEILRESLVVLIYSSGTTGLPKGEFVVVFLLCYDTMLASMKKIAQLTRRNRRSPTFAPEPRGRSHNSWRYDARMALNPRRL